MLAFTWAAAEARRAHHRRYSIDEAAQPSPLESQKRAR